MEEKSKVTIIIDGEAQTFEMDRTDNILNAALDEGIDIPYSCQSGVCTSCLGRIKSGKVSVDGGTALTEEQMSDGAILTCVSCPNSAELIIEIE